MASEEKWAGGIRRRGTMAAETPENLLDRAGADKMVAPGYRFPFPVSDCIAKIGDAATGAGVRRHWME